MPVVVGQVMIMWEQVAHLIGDEDAWISWLVYCWIEMELLVHIYSIKQGRYYIVKEIIIQEIIIHRTH